VTFETVEKQLEEMGRLRAVLESELDDICNREKPAVRQLTDEVRARQALIDEHTAKIETLQNQDRAKRIALQTIQDSEEMQESIFCPQATSVSMDKRF
jgi:hypothetical protein